jgi:peptide-methionine (S)-S-oxide reductase
MSAQITQTFQVQQLCSSVNRRSASIDPITGIRRPCGSPNCRAILFNQVKDIEMTEKAVFAGGCFWGMQDLIRKLTGVIDTRVGYTGGNVPNATYRNHGDHAEAIEIIFDPKTISYRRLLEYFFQIHDPTTRNRQGNDVGRSYRSAIYYVDDEQKRIAEDTIEDVNASGLWPGKVVTEVEPVSDFWQAEPEHQDYLQRYPGGYTCHFPRASWVLPRREAAE